MNDLVGKTVVITGGAGGLGREMAAAFGRERARLAILDIDDRQLAETVDSLRTGGVDANGYHCDVADHQMVVRVAARVRSDFPAVDVLVNNAGIVVGRPAAEIAYDQLRRIVDVNLIGVMWMTRQFIGGMMDRNHGHVVNIASAAGLLAVPRLADYCATKFAVVGYSEALRMEMTAAGCPGVKVACICPSVIDTGMFAGFTPPRFSPLLQPRDVARRIVRTVKRGRTDLKMPFMVRLIPYCKLLPAAWVDRLAALTGTDRAMDRFVGR